MSGVDKQKMKLLLAQELPQVVVASALGCSEGYVSQCLADPQFAAEVAVLKVQKLESVIHRDAALDSLEDKLLEKLDRAANFMLKPADVLAAFKVVNAARRSSTAATGVPTTQLNQQVTIVMPQSIAVSFIRNEQGEIIEAGGRSLATLPAHVLKQMVAQPALPGVTNHGNQQQSIEQVAQPASKAAIEARGYRALEAKAA